METTHGLINSQIVVEVKKWIEFAGQWVTIHSSVFTLESKTSNQVHRPVRSPVRANLGGLRSICFLVEVDPFRFANGVQLCPGVACFRARRKAAFGQTDVQVEAVIVSDALEGVKLCLVLIPKRTSTRLTSEMETFVVKLKADRRSP